MLELAGVCIGLTDEAPPRDVESLARLAVILDQVPAILWTTDGELRVISRAGAGLKSQQMLPERIVGASLLELQSQHKVGSESVAAHRRALAGESVSYQILLPPRRYAAHVEPLRDAGGASVGRCASRWSCAIASRRLRRRIRAHRTWRRSSRAG